MQFQSGLIGSERYQPLHYPRHIAAIVKYFLSFTQNSLFQARMCDMR